MKKILTARSTVLTLFTTITLALLAAVLLPRRAPDAAHPAAGDLLAALVDPDRIIGSGWFAALVALFWLSLSFSTVDQFRAAQRSLNWPPRRSDLAGGDKVAADLGAVQARVSAAGFREAACADGVHRYVKCRSGYWGGFLLHLGLAVTVVFSLVYLLTQHRVMVRLTGQEIVKLEGGSVEERRGPLALTRLPATLLLNRLKPEFWGDDKLAALSSELYFTGSPGAPPARVPVALSDKGSFGSFLVYQANPFGMAFDVTLSSREGGFFRERLFLPYPQGRGRAGYGETELAGTGLTLKGKFLPDPSGASMEPRAPVLTLRLARGGRVLGETTLTPGAAGDLAGYTARLTQVQWWTDVLLDGSRGTGGIFAGFAIILAGAVFSYLVVPRELLIAAGEGGVLVRQRVQRFAQLYQEEYRDLFPSAGSAPVAVPAVAGAGDGHRVEDPETQEKRGAP